MSIYRDAQILVAGGAGFIGRHLCLALLKAGAMVTCLDNFSTSRQDLLWSLQESYTAFRWEVADVSLPIAVDRKYDLIFNLACPASPVHYQRDPLATMRTNVLGALHLLDLANRQDALIFQASTSEVYGDPMVHPQPEDYWGHVNPIGHRSCYDEGKRCAESLFMDYQRMCGVRIKIARFFNTYGPGMAFDDGRVVSNFIVQALQGLPLTVHGDGQQTRSFCYVDDLVAGILSFVMKSDVSGPLNLGNDAEITMHALASLINRLTGNKQALVHLDRVPDDPTQRRPDLQQAKSVLNWVPRYDLETGLVHTIADFRQRLAV